MGILEDFKFSVRGFSPKRMGYLLNLVSLGFVPVHAHVSCEQSGTIAGFALLLMLATLVLCLFTPRSDPHRYRRFSLGLFIFLLHSMSAH